MRRKPIDPSAATQGTQRSADRVTPVATWGELCAGAIAFLVATAHWPWVDESHVTAGWLLLTALLPVSMYFVADTRVASATLPVAAMLGAAFLAFCWAGASWSPAPGSTLVEAWRFTLLACAFRLGACCGSLRLPMLCFTAAVGISGLLGVLQAFGWTGIHTIDAKRAGLFVNKNYLGEAAVAAFAACWALRRTSRWARELMPFALLALVVSTARTAIAAAAVCLLASLAKRWPRTALALMAASFLALAAALPMLAASETGEQRVVLWAATLRSLVPLGHGAGSYFALFPTVAADLPAELWRFSQQPSHPHNEYLALAFEFGIAAVLPLGLLAWGLAGGAMAMFVRGEPRPAPPTLEADHEAAFLALLALAVVALAAFPLRNPATGYLAALCLGHLCRRLPVPRRVAGLWRVPVSSGPGAKGRRAGDRAGPPVSPGAPVQRGRFPADRGGSEAGSVETPGRGGAGQG